MEPQNEEITFTTQQGKKVRVVVNDKDVWFNRVDVIGAMLLCGGGETEIELQKSERMCTSNACYLTGQGLLSMLDTETNNLKTRQLIIEMLGWIEEARIYY